MKKKNISLAALLSSALVVAPLFAFSPIQVVKAFGLQHHTSLSTANCFKQEQPPTFVCRIPQGRNGNGNSRSSIHGKKQLNLSCVLRSHRDGDGHGDGGDVTIMRHEPSSLRQGNAQNDNWYAVRSSLASLLFAFVLVSSSSVEMATARSLVIPTTTPDIVQITTTLVVGSSTASTESMTLLSQSQSQSPLQPPTPQEKSVGSSVGGTIVLGAWIGISGFAGIKGAGDLYKRYRQEQQEE